MVFSNAVLNYQNKYTLCSSSLNSFLLLTLPKISHIFRARKEGRSATQDR